MPPPAVLEVHGLARRVHDHLLLHDVTFTLSREEVLAVTGPSGAGKTTLLRLLNRLDEPTAGTVRVKGHDHRDLAPRALRRRVGYVGQEAALVPGTVAANVALGPRLAGRDVSLRAVEDALAAFDLAGFATRDVDRLSRGQAQRVALARALVNEPLVLLLDEPTANLDEATTRRVELALRDHAMSTGLACVWVTHDPAQAARVADRVLRLRDGRMVKGDAPA